MTASSRAVTSLQRRITAVLWLRQSLLWLAAWCVLWGVGGLVARFAFNETAILGALGIPLALLGALLHANKMRPREKHLVALIDAHTKAGGLLMAASETSLGEWEPKSGAAPRVQWRAKREILLAAIAAAFAVAVLFVPAKRSEAKQTLAIGRDVERLQDRVDVLHEEKILEDAQAAVMEKTLDDLRKEAAADDPAKAWEALDSLDEATAQAAREAGEQAVEQGEQLTKVEAMAFALGSDAVDSSHIAEGMKELENELKAANLDATTSQLGEIAKAARAGKDKLRETLNKLRDRGLIDEKTLRQFEDAANFANRDELGKFLKEHGTGTKLSDAVGEFCMGRPGVDRGRGDAPMFFGEKAQEKGQFDEQTLPAAAAAALNQSEVIAVSAATPDAKDAERSQGGALTNAKPGGGSAFTSEVLPRHRGTVTRFFERKK